MSAKITLTRQVVRISFLTTNQFDRAGYGGHNIATDKTVRTFLTAKTIAITASSFFLLPSSFFLLLYQPSWTHCDSWKPGFLRPCATGDASFRKKNPVSWLPCVQDYRIGKNKLIPCKLFLLILRFVECRMPDGD